MRHCLLISTDFCFLFYIIGPAAAIALYAMMEGITFVALKQEAVVTRNVEVPMTGAKQDAEEWPFLL